MYFKKFGQLKGSEGIEDLDECVAPTTRRNASVLAVDQPVKIGLFSSKMKEAIDFERFFVGKMGA